MSDIHILRQKISISAERLAGAALQPSLIEEIAQSTIRVFLEMLDMEITAKVSNRMVKPAVSVIDAMRTVQYNIVEMHNQTGLVGLSSEFIETAVSGLTGAPSQSGGGVDRPPTPTDTALSGLIFNEMLSHVFDTEIEIQGFEIDKAPLIFLLQDDRYASMNIEIFDLEGASLGNLELVLPLPCIESFTAPNTNEPDHRQLWHNHMHAVAEIAPLELDSVIQRIPVSLDTVLNLKIGDVLDVSEGSLEHLEMAASTPKGQHVIFKGQLGSLKTHKAFRVSSLSAI